MANTYSQIYIQVVFAVKGRQSLISETWEDRLQKYITGIVKEKEQKLLAINGVSDHIHFLIDMKPTCCLSDLVREIKKSSNDFISANQFTKLKFSWQGGFGAFSYHTQDLDRIIAYIMNQKEHHRTKSFREEYLGLLEQFKIEFKPEYLFDWIE